MSSLFPLPSELPAAAEGAIAIARKLIQAGHVALLAGGCVRDLLLGRQPQDYDVATDAPPARVGELFHPTRLVGARFGVVLVRRNRQWIEVATFRSDGPYLDGRHPTQVHFTDARQDARRRDFTVNGMFLDPLKHAVIDYVDGQADLQAGLIRAIGDPTARFDEDQLRLLRAVRFAARLDFTIEPRTLTAIHANAAKLASVAPERVREELERMLVHPQRQQAFRLLRETGLLPHLWSGASWQPQQIAAADALLGRLPQEATFELAFAAFVADRSVPEIQTIGRALTFSNEQRENTVWLVKHQAGLDVPETVALADLKRLMAHRVFDALRDLAEVRHGALPDGGRRTQALADRLAAIPPESIQPLPLVTGDDLTQRGVPAGPVYKRILDALYTRQLDETIRSRAEALVALDAMLAEGA